MLIDNSNIILDLNLGDDLTFSKADQRTIFDKFNLQIIKGILKDFSIREFRRIGYVRNYIIDSKDFADTFVKRTIGENLDGVNDIDLRFSKKIPILESLAKKDVNDYDNSIFNIIKLSNKDEIFVSLDYQRFFDPFLPDFSQINLDSFIETAHNFNNKTLITWLNRNYVETVNE